MKVTFLGVGSTLSQKNANSNLLVEQGDVKLCIDCGRSAFASVEQYGLSLKDMTHVLITHLRADKVSGLEEIAFMTKFVFKFKIKLLGTATILERLWQYCLKGGLEYIEETPGNLRAHFLNDYFEVLEVPPSQWFSVDETSSLACYLHPTDHIKGMESYGVEVREGKSNDEKRFFFTGDTKFNPDLIAAKVAQNSHIFHDCQILDHGEQNALQWHATYNQLRHMPLALKKKIWLYHYEDAPRPNAREDGFAGFVQHLQSFNL